MQRRAPQLDGIRGIAILLVILHNERAESPSLGLSRLLAHGWMGVDLFFVVSGLLITGILIDTMRGQHPLRNFYARRCLRTWPLYYAVLVFMFVVVPFLRPQDAQTIFERSSPWWAYPPFLQNFLVSSPTMAPGPLAVTWSLAVEEQFYLVWPWVVRYCTRLQLSALAIAVLCLSPVLRLFLSYHGVDLYTNVFCRLDGLMAGALLALAFRRDGFQPGKFVKRAWLCLLLTVPLALAAEALGTQWAVFSLTALASTSLVYLALFSSGRGLQRLVTSRFLVYTGTISYGLYLLHKIPFDVARAVKGDRSSILTLLVACVGCYVAAIVSWNVLEKPMLKLKRLFDPGARILSSRV